MFIFNFVAVYIIFSLLMILQTLTKILIGSIITIVIFWIRNAMPSNSAIALKNTSINDTPIDENA